MAEISIGAEMDITPMEEFSVAETQKGRTEGSKRSVSESQVSSKASTCSLRKNLKRSTSAVDLPPSKRYSDLQQSPKGIAIEPLYLTSAMGSKFQALSPSRSPLNQADLNSSSSPKRGKRHRPNLLCDVPKLPSPVRFGSYDQEVVDLTEADLPQDQPQDLSRPRSVQSERRTPPPPYPVELQVNFRALSKGTLKEHKGKENEREYKDGIKREPEDTPLDNSSLTTPRLPIINSDKILDVLQHQIMVAETVKYPVNYPALIPLSPSVAGLGGGYSCSSSMIHANFSNAHMMDQKPPQQQQQQQLIEPPSPLDHQGLGSPHSNGQDSTPVGLGAPGLHIPSTLELAAQLRKKDMFTQRKQREFIPDSKKDESYWDRRRRNNEAAKRSREKRRFNDMILEQRVIELSKENHIMKSQLNAIKEKYGILGENVISMEQVIASMPQTDQIIALNKRTKFNTNNLMSLGSSPSVTSLLSPEGSISSPTPTPSYQGNDAPESPQNYSHYGSAHDDHDSHFDGPDQYPPNSNSDLYYNPGRTSALNLSTHSSTSHSPLSPTTSHMEYSPASDHDICRRSPGSEAGSSLPHKLRHKSHLGDKDAAQSLLALQGIKAEPHDPQQEAAEDSVGSSDERDSGISYSSSSSCSDGYHRSSDTSSSPTNCMVDTSISRTQQPLHQQQQHHYPHHQEQQQHLQLKQQQQHHHQQQQQQQQDDDEVMPEYENTQLRSELERLASEVATLKYMLVRRPRSEGDSDGSR